MFLLRKPGAEQIRSFIGEQASLAFTYPCVGGTASATAPAGYRSDHSRFRLGCGEAVFDRAKQALTRWRQFDLGWSRAWPDDTPLEPGRTVAVVFHTFGLWCVCSARIVYRIDEPNRLGFAYGTLPGHVESGEERFLIEMADDGSVHYDITAFSRPRHILTRLGFPYVRWLQRQFVCASGAAMRNWAS